MAEGDARTLEAILRTETFEREDPAILELYDYVSRDADEVLVARIVWQLGAHAQQRCGHPACIGARTRTTITNYPSLAAATAPREFLTRLRASSAGDLYSWVSLELQAHPFRRDLLAPSLLANGWIEGEVDAAQVGVVLPFDYFEHRPGMSENERDAVIRSYALEQAMVL